MDELIKHQFLLDDGRIVIVVIDEQGNIFKDAISPEDVQQLDEKQVDAVIDERYESYLTVISTPVETKEPTDEEQLENLNSNLNSLQQQLDELLAAKEELEIKVDVKNSKDGGDPVEAIGVI